MPPPTGRTNFRTYEAQSRLLAAVIASNPNMKLNFQAIFQHYGSDTSLSSIEHRFRPIKKQAFMLRQAVRAGKDPKDLAGLFHLSDNEIAKYYGESTQQGIEFQFRAIKKDAKALREAVAKGASPLTTRERVPAGRDAAPARKRRAAAPVTPATGAAEVAESVAPAQRPVKRRRAAYVPVVNDDNDTLDSDEVDYEQLDLTPSSTPSHRMAATAATAAAAASSSVPITPSTTMPPAAGFVSDYTHTTTPALSTGVSPAENDSPDNDVVFHTAVQQQRPPLPPAFYVRDPVTIEDDEDEDEDEDDNDVFIIDTPSKMPKLEAPAPSAPLAPPTLAASTATLGLGDFGDWDNSADHSLGPIASQQQVHSQGHFPFDTSGSSWSHLDYYPSAAADPMASFAGSASFYENEDGAV